MMAPLATLPGWRQGAREAAKRRRDATAAKGRTRNNEGRTRDEGPNLTVTPRMWAEPAHPELEMSMPRNDTTGRTPRGLRATHALAIAYSAQNAYYGCITPKAQYWRLNAFEGDMCDPSFMRELSKFINRTVRDRS